MNPETKLTVEELRKICARHGITYSTHERITTGFSHEVHRLNEDLVIKLFNKESNKNFLCESNILAVKDARILKPQLITAYESSGQERSYIIMSYVPGKSLGGVWHLASKEQRERLIGQISKVLQAFQDVDTTLLDFSSHSSWSDYLERKSKKLLTKLREKGIITSEKSDEITNSIDKLARYFPDNEPMQPIYWDIHFDNFIVNDDFELQAIIDLENVRILPIDYPLFVVQKQMKEPHKYLAEQEEKYAKKEDYSQLWEWYHKYYPEMFEVNHLEMRLKLYQLLDELHLMIDWSHNAELRASFSQLMKEISSI